jgi:hypothetical protein
MPRRSAGVFGRHELDAAILVVHPFDPITGYRDWI